LYRNGATPGPGNYNLKSSIDLGKGVTMISRRSAAEVRELGKVPGPGAYEPHLLPKKSAPSYRIGSASRNNLSIEALRVPGPGAY